MNKKDKKIYEFEIDHLIIEVYNKIAEWHNEDSTDAGLKQMSIELIEDISKAVFKHLEIPYSGQVKLDEETKREAIRERIEKEKSKK